MTMKIQPSPANQVQYFDNTRSLLPIQPDPCNIRSELILSIAYAEWVYLISEHHYKFNKSLS